MYYTKKLTLLAFFIILTPASLPVAQLEVRLYPPVTPSTSIISPPHHKDGTIHKTKADADESEE